GRRERDVYRAAGPRIERSAAIAGLGEIARCRDGRDVERRAARVAQSNGLCRTGRADKLVGEGQRRWTDTGHRRNARTQEGHDGTSGIAKHLKKAAPCSRGGRVESHIDGARGALSERSAAISGERKITIQHKTTLKLERA